MGTTKLVAPVAGGGGGGGQHQQQQHHSLTHQSSNSNLNRNSLKASAGQVRWPVSLNQLAAMNLDDDSDIDRSLTDGKTCFFVVHSNKSKKQFLKERNE